MRKIILTAVLAVLAMAGWAEAQSPKVVKVTAERTGLRDRPDTSATVLVTISKGDELDVIETAGTWYKVRAKGSNREGYVHSLFVEAVGAGSTSSPAPAPTATTSTPPPAATTASAPATTSQTSTAFQNTPVPDGQRTLGAGITTGGLAFGFTPSVRYWMNEQTGFEVNFSFLDSAGYSVTAISPSVLFRIGEAKRAGTVAFQPYAGGGITLWHYSDDFNDYYCDLAGVDCDSSSIGVGGFGGTEILFDAVPKLAASASIGFYSSPSALGYGGVYLSIAGHWYFK